MSLEFAAIGAGVVLAGISNPSLAQPPGVGAIEVTPSLISISGNGHRKSFPCNGRKLEIMGSDHVITVTGQCTHVDLSGANNTLDVTIAPKGTLEVSGSEHTVRWKAEGDITQEISGADHRITRQK